MIALLFTVLLALYLLGPDLVARWILSFAAPRKAVLQNRSEEVARAVIWASAPLTIAWQWARRTKTFTGSGDAEKLRTFFTGVLSDSFLRANEQSWFDAAGRFLRLNMAVLWRLYLIVGIAAVALTTLTVQYRHVRRWLRRDWLRKVFGWVILPRVAEWHVLLSDMLLPEKDMVLHADILTDTGLYQGVVKDKVLGLDGTLRTITLASPYRFMREDYDAARQTEPEVDSAGFWKAIPGNLFVIVGGEITNLNLRYSVNAPAQIGAPNRKEHAVLEELLSRLRDEEAE